MKKRSIRILLVLTGLTMLFPLSAILAESAETAEAAAEAVTTGGVFNTFWSLMPPIIAIVLALITKEVYSSLLIGIFTGALLYTGGNIVGSLNRVLRNGIVVAVTDAYNMGILIFLITLGILVCLMNRAGGSAAFGRWASEHIHSRVGTQLITIALGVVIFIDDYFNCLTVGSVMRPVTDKYKVSRAKLAYLIDATAAPVCIIAPISSWAAAVAGFAEEGQGLNLFIAAIPFNFYAILTIIMMVGLTLMKCDFGPMAKFEKNATENGDLFSGSNPYAEKSDDEIAGGGRVADLVFPIVTLIVCCVTGMVYTGGFFSGVGFIKAFSDCDASVGLMLGSFVALIVSVIYFLFRKVLNFKQIMECVPEGFKAMVPAILILTLAWTLKGITTDLGATNFVHDVVSGATGVQSFLPAIVFVVGCLLSFATGTSWGTFGMLIPIVQSVFSMDNPLAIVCISACMAGAVCGDHCSPISDTTIMSSAGAQCDHVNHVSTQIPYAAVCAVVSLICYIIAGFVPNAGVMLPLSIGVMLLTLVAIRVGVKSKN
ncbi:MAG: Na+/H+ antiporter NhaC family protein [Clostridia bacterium]|nr:Na+/H+ antiporter NhaC family protein [Clostridia bacterium]